MLVGLLVIGASLLLGARRVLRAELDRGLQAALELQTATLSAGQSLAPIEEWPDPEAFGEHVNRFVALRDTLGNVLSTNTSSARQLPLDREALLAAAHGARMWVFGDWQSHHLRSVYAPAPENSVLQIGALLDPIDAVFTQLFAIMLGTVVLTTGASAIGARWLARSAAAPVAEITRQINRIDDVVTTEGITVHADAEEYRDLVSVLNDMLDRLRRAGALQRRIIANTGHDIRTPITVIQGELEIALRAERTPEQYRRTLTSCLEEARYLSSISDKLLLLARIETGILGPKREPIDVTRLISRSIESLPVEHEKHTIDFQVSLSNASAMVDEFLLGVALREILENALRHTPPGTVVSVTVATVDEWIQVTVDDGGPGVPAEHLGLLFELTHREDAARTRTGGAGLGLAIVAAVIRLHEGGFHAGQSHLGGLRLTLQLPAARQELRQ